MLIILRRLRVNFFRPKPTHPLDEDVGPCSLQSLGASRNARDRWIPRTHRVSHTIGDYAGLRLHRVRGRGKALNLTAESSEMERVRGSQRPIGKASKLEAGQWRATNLARGRRQPMNSRRRNSTSTGGFSPPQSFFLFPSLLFSSPSHVSAIFVSRGRRWPQMA